MGDRNPSAIESDLEATRQRLAATIDQLAYRTSPKTIAKREVNQVKGFFVGPDGPRTDNILKVVGGIAGAVLVLGIVRKIVK